MKKFFNTVVVLIAFHSINISSQDQIEEIIVTSAFIDTSEINNLYILLMALIYQTVLPQV